MSHYTRAQAAKELGVTVRTVDNYLRDNVLCGLEAEPTPESRARILIPHREVAEVKKARDRLKLQPRAASQP